MQVKNRPFATGSKPGPDAIDHYLEEKGFYRKHVARDASSLFRVVSEQVFDVQNYHEKVRQDCAAYMEARTKEFANEVDKNLHNYIGQLRRNRTHGSLLELRVMARKYRKNVILFEPTNNLQTTSIVYVHHDDYDSDNPLRVYYSPKDKHFDVIYTMDYVERLAECQAIVYDILYSCVFRLPDVNYAVERMLHDQEEALTLPLPDDATRYTTQSGEIGKFDSHTATQCVLKDPRTCHFHNQLDFEQIVEDHKDAISVINRADERRLKIYKPIDGFLYDDTKSCVRQLLDEGITPFPYKVAKALDPSIYRNTEFELWSENRKEQRIKWFDSAEIPMKQFDEYGLYEKPQRQGNKWSDNKFDMVLDQHRYMELDEESKKKYIILDPSAEPFKLHQLTGLDHFVPSRDQLEFTVMPIDYYRDNYLGDRGNRRQQNDRRWLNHGSNQSHHHNNPNNPPHVQEIEAETSEHQEQPTFQPEERHFDAQPMYQQVPTQSWNNQLVPYMSQQQQPSSSFQGQYVNPMSYNAVMPHGNFTIPPPATGHEVSTSMDPMNIIREQELASMTVKWKPTESLEKDGNDLPKDTSTLQLFFNLGVRYFYASGQHRRFETISAQMEKLDVSGTSANIDAPPVPTNTPVTTKSLGSAHRGPPGSRYGHPNANNRRPFPMTRDGPRDGQREGQRAGRGNNNNTRDWNHRSWANNSNNDSMRKEIKFNSNVKNAPKMDHKGSGAGQPSAAQTQTFQSSPQATSSVHEKNGETSTSTASQISPISPPTDARDSMYSTQFQPMQDAQQMQETPQFYQTYQQQQSFAPQPGVAMIYQLSEEGLMTPMSQQQHFMPQYHFNSAPPTPQPFQPFYYHYPQQQTMDGNSTMGANDSMMDAGNFQSYQQQPAPYYAPFQSHVPMYYAQTPLPQTPQIAQVAPMFPAPGQLQSSISAPMMHPPVVAVATAPTMSAIIGTASQTEEHGNID